MKIRHFLFATLLSMLLLTSCGGVRVVNLGRKAMKVQLGMTTEQVMKELGKPDYRRIDALRSSWEQWEYRGMLFNSSQDVMVIDFQNNRVASLDSYNELRPVIPDIPDNNSDN